jgi:hypothetical protein
MPQPILIDTDAGDDVDDVLAIAFALLRPELDIKAITTVSPHSARRAGHGITAAPASIWLGFTLSNVMLKIANGVT